MDQKFGGMAVFISIRPMMDAERAAESTPVKTTLFFVFDQSMNHGLDAVGIG